MNKLIESLTKFHEDHNFRRPEWLVSLREKSLNELKKGPPSTKNELWRYFPMKNVENFYYLKRTDRSCEKLFPSDFLQNSPLLILAAGLPSPNFSKLDKLPTTLEVNTLSQMVQNGQDYSEWFNNDKIDYNYALTHGLFDEAAVVETKENSENGTLYILNVAAEEKNLLSSNHLLVHVRKNSTLTLIQKYIGPSEEKYSLSESQKYLVESGAHLKIINVYTHGNSTDSFHHHSAKVESGGNIEIYSIVLNGERVHTQTNIQLLEPNAWAKVYGLNVLKNNNQAHHFTTIHHLSRETYSDELFKNVLQDESIAYFRGSMVLAPHTTDVISNQKNKSLLLSKKAKVYTEPILEIAHDSVKCSHGASVGRPNNEEIFYLQSRGLSHEQALALHTMGFIGDWLGHLSKEESKWLKPQILEKFYGTK